MAHQLPSVPPPHTGAGLPHSEPAQQHQGDGGLPAVHRLGPAASGRSAAVPPAAAPGPRRSAPRRSVTGRVRQQQPGDAVHHRVHGHDAVAGLGALRQLPELQTRGSDHRLRVRHLLLPLHAGAALHGPHLCAQPQHPALTGRTHLPVGGQHPGHVLGGGHVAHLLAQIQTGP